MRTSLFKRAWIAILISFFLSCTTDIPPKKERLIFEEISHEFPFADSSRSYAAAIADFNQDGYEDIAISFHFGPSVAIYFNSPEGFTSPPVFPRTKRRPIDYHGITVSYFNEDTFPDLALAVGANRGVGVGKNELYLMSDSGIKRSYQLPMGLIDSLGRSRAIIPWDINQDGEEDYFVMNLWQEDRPHRILIGVPESPGDFEELKDTYFASLHAMSLLPVNVNPWAPTLFFLQKPGKDAGRVLSYDPKSGFQEIKGFFPKETIGTSIHKIVPLDFDNDGDLDLFMVRGKTIHPSANLMTDSLGIQLVLQPYKKAYHIQAQLASPPLPQDSLFFDLTIGGQTKYSWQKIHLGKNMQNPEKNQFALAIHDTSFWGKPQIEEARQDGVYIWWESKTNRLHYTYFPNNARQLFQNEGVIRLSGKGFTSLDFEGGVELSPQQIQKRFSNRLFKNDRGKFTDVTKKARITSSGTSMDAIAGDFNNDFLMDLYIVNAIEMGNAFQNGANQLWLNQGNGTFQEVASETSLAGSQDGRGNGALGFDFDKDGDLDIFVYNGSGLELGGQGPLQLFENQLKKNSNYLNLKLKGPESRGARVIAKLGSNTLYQQKHSSDGHLATSDKVLHIGIGQAEQLDSLIILWPSGAQTKMANVAKNQELSLSDPKLKN